MLVVVLVVAVVAAVVVFVLVVLLAMVRLAGRRWAFPPNPSCAAPATANFTHHGRGNY